MGDTSIYQCVCCGESKKCLKCPVCLNKLNLHTYYCSKQCQTEDWKSHKEVHNQRADFKGVSQLLKIAPNIRYFGPLKNGIPFGNTGTLTTISGANKEKFTGCFNGTLPARGTKTYIEGINAGNVFEGTFDNLGRVYKGKITYPDGKFFQGRISAETGMLESGSFTFPGLGTYNGKFTNNAINGEGTFKYTEGAEYIGNWVNGKREGLGTYRKEDRLYNGQWLANDLVRGTLVIETTGSTYAGGFAKTNRNTWDPSGPTGTLMLPNKYMYQGNFNLGVPDGQGQVTFLPQGEVVEGFKSQDEWAQVMQSVADQVEEVAAGGGGEADGHGDVEVVDAYADIVDILSMLHAKINLLEGSGVAMHS